MTLRVTDYNEGSIVFYCDSCNDYGIYTFKDRITSDCAFIVEPACQCGNKGKLYFMYSSTEYKTKELLAAFDALKYV